MSLFIDRESVSSAREDGVLHLVPCKIEHNGEANVADYFTTGIRESELGLTASFRGRPLNGHKIVLPSGYSGYILKEPLKTYNEEEDRHLRVTHTFNEFTGWNLDLPPSKNDKLIQAMEWIDIAKAIHSPVDTESSQKSVVGK